MPSLSGSRKSAVSYLGSRAVGRPRARSIKLTYLHTIAGSGTWLVMTAPPAGIKILTTFSNGATIWCLALVADV
jgi:hypothetical protein